MPNLSLFFFCDETLVPEIVYRPWIKSGLPSPGTFTLLLLLVHHRNEEILTTYIEAPSSSLEISAPKVCISGDGWHGNLCFPSSPTLFVWLHFRRKSGPFYKHFFAFSEDTSSQWCSLKVELEYREVWSFHTLSESGKYYSRFIAWNWCKILVEHTPLK